MPAYDAEPGTFFGPASPRYARSEVLPQVSATYRQGELSYSKVRAITRIATPETEAYLLQIARYGTAAHVEGLVSKYRRCKRLQDRNNALRQHTPLCRYHHRLLHEHGFRRERTETGEIRFTNTLGIEIRRTGALPPVADDVEPREWLKSELPDLEIDARTGVTQWRGEPIDWHLAVGHLFEA